MEKCYQENTGSYITFDESLSIKKIAQICLLFPEPYLLATITPTLYLAVIQHIIHKIMLKV